MDLPGFDKEETAEFYVNHYRLVFAFHIQLCLIFHNHEFEYDQEIPRKNRKSHKHNFWVPLL